MGERERTDMIGQLRSLPQRGEEIWQAGIAQMPVWVGERLEESERPWVGVCVSLTSQALNMTEPAMPEEAGFELVLRALLGGMMGSGMRGYLPGTLRVSDPELAAYLRAALRETPVRVEQRDDDDALRQVMSFMQEGTQAAMTPGALDGDGVDVERMRAFAEAARRFYAAAPWRHLNDYDLIEVESPKVPEAVRFVSVMGSGGMQYGFGFFPSRRVYERLYEGPGDPGMLMKHGTAWSVTYGPIQELPLEDADLFSDQGLPVAADRAYPVALGIGKRGVTRPDAAMLNLFEGLLLAIAQSTEDDFDAGRWRKTVRTFDGDVEFVLSIPSLLEAMQGPGAAAGGAPDPAASMRKLEREMRRLLAVAQERGITSAEGMNAFIQQRLAEAPATPSAPQAPRTPAEEAQDLVYDAMDAVGRRQVQLIRRAISIDPDCADAYNLLADRTGDPRESEPLYRRAMEAARRSLDPELFRSAVGHFWGVMETRPYMRAVYGLAESLDRQNRFDEAIEQYQEMLRLNPNDNQGARYALAPALYRANRIEECLRLLERYDGPSAATLYLKALVLFRMQGDSAAAREAAARAVRENRHMVKYLTGRAELPPAGPPTYSPGSDDEAVTFAFDLIDLWENMPGALEWLERQKPAKAKGKPRAKGTGKGKGKGKKRS